MSFRLVVGVEIHAKIKSATKLFSRACASIRDPATGRPPAPNSFVGWLDCALPGAMPRLNQYCVNQAIVTGLAFGGEVQRYSVFERKHYFYCGKFVLLARVGGGFNVLCDKSIVRTSLGGLKVLTMNHLDSPLGYQITQQSFPIVLGGTVTLSDAAKVRIARVQLEQDTGKSFHFPGYTLVDFNRAGAPLMEIVSEPDMKTANEAANYVRTVQRLLRHIGSCDGNMEDGSLRADINISVHDDVTGRRSQRVEVKNLNSIRSIERAVLYEHKRLEGVVAGLSNSQPLNNETRTFDVTSGETVVMREKEGQVDYRFMVEPDLPPLIVSEDRIERIKHRMQELPEQARARFAKGFGLRPSEIDILMVNPALSAFFEAVVSGTKSATPSLVATLICNNLLGALRKQELEDDPFLYVDVEEFQQLADRLHQKRLSMQRAKELVAEKMVKQAKIDWEVECTAEVPTSPCSNSSSTRADVIQRACDKVLDEFPGELVKYREGKHTLFNFFFGKAFAALKQDKQLKPAPEVLQVREAMETALKWRCEP